MRTILAIFARDVRRIVKSPVALVVTCGVALIPSLYAWCNILANWDPYANTGNIQVAVANEDLGTDSTLVGHLDAGAQTVRKLRTNHQLGWRFVSKSDALNGVKSGEYYAAIVLPDDFSATLIGSVTGTTKRPHITYYVNEKENAIAPKITDTGATEIDEQINSTFVTAVADAVATEVKRSAQATTQSLDGAQSDVIADLNTTIDQLNSVRDELTHMSTSLSDAETTIAKAQDTNKQISADLATATGTANTTIGLLADAQTASQRFSTTLAKALDNGSVQLSSLHIGVNTATGQIVSGLNTTQSAVNAVSQAMQKTCDKTDEFIDGLDRVLASSGLDHNSKEYQALAQQIADARTQLKQEQQLLDTFGNNADALIGDGTTTATTLGNTIAGLTADGANKLIDARDKLTGTIMPSLDSSFTSLSATSGSLIGTLDALGSLIGQSDGLLNQLDDTLRQTRTTLDSTIGALGDLEGNLDATRTDVAALSSSQTYEQITKLLGLNAASIGDFMGNPVHLSEIVVYPTDNYGSAVTPFYTNLALWVGGFVLVAIYKLEVDRDERIRNYTPTQGYLGRWLLFMTVGFMQAIIVTVGDIALGIQCAHPMLFILAGLLESFIYVNIIYALAATFRHIGKAVAVVLVIVQIPGASGLYPIEMMPEFFQRLKPFLPFTYGIQAMRGPIAGLYKMHYWNDMFHLLWYLPVALFIGLVVRRLAMNLNALFDERLADTDLMITERNAGVDSQLRFVGMAREFAERYPEIAHARAERFLAVYPKLVRWGPHVGGAAVRTADSAVHHPTENRDAYVVDRVDHRHRHLSDRGRIPEGKVRAVKYLWGIFRRDMRHATSNVIALIVSMGLVIVPALYAWFNIAASWDPYGNTKALKVAVANVDSGYKSELIPVRINVGETVLSALRANHQLDWQFVDSAKAVDGVKSGKYYAAIVIPKSFSADMMTLFSPTVKHATLKYYLNEKINPIAPHITDEGASTVANTIDKTFAKTMAQVGLDLAADMLQYSQSPQMTQYMTNLTSNIDGMVSTISGAQAQVNAYSTLLGSADSVITSTDKLLASTRKAGKQARKTLKQSGTSTSTLTDACTNVTDAVNQALQQAVSALDDVADKVGTAFDQLDKDATGAAKTLQDLSSQVSSSANVYGNYIAQLEKMRSAVEGLPDGDSKQALLNAIDKQIAALQAAQQDTQDLATALAAASKQVAADSGDIQRDRQQILNRITTAKRSITTVQSDYEQNVKPKLDDLSASVQTLVTQTGTVISGLDAVTGDVGSMAGSIGANVAAVRKTLGSVSASLGESAGKLSDLSTKFKQAVQAGDSSAIASLTSSDTDAVATLLSAPVALDRVPIYPIANYGSAMAPFYTVLSIWVGAIILVAIMKVAVSDREKAHVLGLGDSLPLRARNREIPGNAATFGLRLHHEYFGRLGIFALLALLQGTIVCLGDMYFLGVQAEHPLQFLAVGWLCAVVFSNIVYTLTVSFGDIGKALAVVLLVMQVAGSGGTFPIQTLPRFFQICYPFLPFPHAIDAMHAAMAGSYGLEYWIDLGALALFLLPSLLLGLVLRRPVIRLNNWVLRRLESTHVM